MDMIFRDKNQNQKIIVKKKLNIFMEDLQRSILEKIIINI